MAKKQQDDFNAPLLNVISPMGIKLLKSDRIQVGEVEGQTLGAIRYPSVVSYEWLTDVCNLNNTITTLAYTPAPASEIEQLIKSIGATINSNQLIVDGLTSNDKVEQTRAKKIVADGTAMLDNVINRNDSIGYLSLNNFVFGENNLDITKNIQSVKNKYAGKKFSLRTHSFAQLEAFQAISPFNRIDSNPVISDVTNYLIPLETMLGGFPFAFSGYNDGEGTYWGKDSSGGLIIVDLWKRGQDRVNSNLVMLGVSGMGKSTTLKHLLLNEWETGTKIIIIDPQGEYKEMCQSKEIVGDWINIANGDGGRINRLQIYKKPVDDDDISTRSVSDLAQHINELEIFFKLYRELNPTLSAVLKECLEETYRAKKITFETDIRNLKPSDYPIMKDLYNTTLEMADKAIKTLRDSETNYYKELAILLRDIADGSDSLVWNGHSTVEPQSDFIVFDTSKVKNSSDSVRKALYNTVLSYCKEILYRDKNERVILICDEAHTAIDKRIPETVAELDLISRTVRKNESALWICSHQLNDFLDPNVRKEGEALLEQPNIKLFMPVGKGRNLSDLRELYSFTDAEEERLLEQQRGKGLLFIGSRRLSIDFQIPPHHFEMMGTSGGR
ncbi:MAG: AAA-like domain protein [Oscillospiraceae bacterium]|nr:AAA-like domain protein [Oscillospiraceae bacterium]